LQARVKSLAEIIIALVRTNSNHSLDGAIAARLMVIPYLFYLAHIQYEPDMPLFQRLSFPQASLRNCLMNCHFKSLQLIIQRL